MVTWVIIGADECGEKWRGFKSAWEVEMEALDGRMEAQDKGKKKKRKDDTQDSGLGNWMSDRTIH